MEEYGFEFEMVYQNKLTLSNPMKLVEADLKGQLINYQENPIDQWCLGNASMEIDNFGNVMAVKINNQQNRRIDGAVTLIILYEMYRRYRSVLFKKVEVIKTGFLDIFKKKSKEHKYAQMLNGSIPVFAQFGTNIYASDVVQQAVNCIVLEMKKLNPQHIREVEHDITPVVSEIQRVLQNPNELMTTSEFIEKIMWLTMLNYNCFIIPTYEKKKADRAISCQAAAM